MDEGAYCLPSAPSRIVQPSCGEILPARPLSRLAAEQRAARHDESVRDGAEARFGGRAAVAVQGHARDDVQSPAIVMRSINIEPHWREPRCTTSFPAAATARNMSF